MLQVAIFQALTLTAPDNVLALYAATSEQSSSVSESLPLWQLIAVRGTTFLGQHAVRLYDRG